MSLKLMDKAFDIRVGNPLRKLILVKLADNASDQGECWPSYQHIANQCEISKRSVMSHIDALCEMGLIRKEYRSGPKGNASNLYYLTLDGAGDSPGGSEGAAPRISHSFESVKEPVNEPKDIGASADAPAQKRSSRDEYSPEFETAWQTYPKRAGGNPKAGAWKHWKARLKEGVKPEAMLEGVKRYAAFVQATGNAGTQYVKQAVTFFGPDRHFEESWQVPSGQSGGRRGGLPVAGFSNQDYGQSNCDW